jgi:hypothetical protein
MFKAQFLAQILQVFMQPIKGGSLQIVAPEVGQWVRVAKGYDADLGVVTLL